MTRALSSRRDAAADRPLLLTAREIRQVRQCLEILEQAQNLVDTAAQALCPVRGFADEWSHTGKAHDAVQREWVRIHNRLQDLLADGRGQRGGCPRCGAALAGDGSCCDNCRWTRPAGG